MLLVSDRPLYIRDELHVAGVPFEIDEEYGASLLTAGTARHAAPPRILYENHTRQQDADGFRKQGVSCICVTKNRRAWLPQAIASYQAQSYTPRELIIIADGDDVRDLVPEQDDIRLVQIDNRNIGAKRNLGVSMADGRYVAHWDDDDYSAPDRLMDQVTRLRHGLPVTGYSQIDFTDGTEWWRYSGDDGFAPGSTLLYERSWALEHPFPFIQVGEDGSFVEAARRRGKIATAPSNGMLTATIHKDNTSPRNFWEERFWSKLDQSPTGLSVIVPSKNESNFIPCVEAVRQLEPNARIILVDDGCFASHPYELKEGFTPSLEPFMAVQGTKPFIFARNINIGIRAAGRDDVILLNDDAILKTPNGFSLLRDCAKEHPEFGVIASTTNAVGNRNQHRQGIGLREDPRQVCFVCVFIPRTTLDKIGYLDERFTAYGFEDDDFCYRVRRAGLKIGIHDGCFVDHASLQSTFRGGAYKGATNLADGQKIFVEKWGAYPL